MRAYLIRRAVQFVPVLLGIALVTFAIVRLAPGDPASLLVDVTLLSPEELERFRHDLGLDAPMPVQFFRIVAELATGQLRSFRTGQPVLAILAERLPVTPALLGGSIVLAVLAGVPLGVLSARAKRGLYVAYVPLCRLRPTPYRNRDPLRAENLFTRPSAMSFESDAAGRQAIEDHAELNRIVVKDTYTESDKDCLVKLSERYKFHALNPPRMHL